MSIEMIREAVSHHWGNRCQDFEVGCASCQAWSMFDALVAAHSAVRHGEPPVAIELSDDRALATRVEAMVCAAADEATLATGVTLDEFAKWYMRPADTSGLIHGIPYNIQREFIGDTADFIVTDDTSLCLTSEGKWIRWGRGEGTPAKFRDYSDARAFAKKWEGK